MGFFKKYGHEKIHIGLSEKIFIDLQEAIDSDDKEETLKECLEREKLQIQKSNICDGMKSPAFSLYAAIYVAYARKYSMKTQDNRELELCEQQCRMLLSMLFREESVVLSEFEEYTTQIKKLRNIFNGKILELSKDYFRFGLDSADPEYYEWVYLWLIGRDHSAWLKDTFQNVL